MNVNTPHDPLFFTVAQVRFSREGKVKENSFASGFFYKFENKLYFITNRHVVIDEVEGHQPDKLSLELHVDRNNLYKKDSPLKIDLYDEKNKQKWREHPRNNDIKNPNEMIDVVAIPIDKKEISKYYIEPFESRGHDANYDLTSWDNLIVIGYPEGYYDSEANLPIIRRANLASASFEDFEKPKYGNV